MGNQTIKESPIENIEDIDDMDVQYTLASKYLRNDPNIYHDKRKEALRLLEKSANQGHTEAMYALGQIHRNGYYYVCGLTFGINLDEAYKWFELGYMNGHIKCTKELRSMTKTITPKEDVYCVNI
jgi:TPR repeat protein